MCANYILFGKDKEDGESSVDRGEIQIDTKFKSWKKQEPVSLEALIEATPLNENLLTEHPVQFKKQKQKLDKEKVKDVPGMQELWKQIQIVQDLVDENMGKKLRRPQTRVLTQKELYYYRHFLIQLKTQQYYLLGEPIPHPPANRARFRSEKCEEQMNYKVFPRGVMRRPDDMDFQNPRQDSRKSSSSNEELREAKTKRKFYIDFRNEEHVYQLILAYGDLKEMIRMIPDSPLYNLLWTLDFYIEKAKLTDQQRLIIEGKKSGMSNKEIQWLLEEKLNVYHQENYVSTLWCKAVRKINAAAVLNYDEWLFKDFDKEWKVCSSCGRELLRDSRNFIRKAKAIDGLTGICKECERKRRGGLKNEIGKEVN